MATIPTMTLPGTVVDTKDIYDNGLYKPANPPQSLEILNGGMEQANYGGGTNSIKPYMMDMGTFARGYSSNFSRREFIYAKQCDEDYTGNPIVTCSLSTEIFLPFTARTILYGYQCWFNHDASSFTNTTPTGYEFWRYYFEVNNASTPTAETASKALTGRLPYGRQRLGAGPSYAWKDYNSSGGPHEERRWYYVQKNGMLTNPASGLLSKGHKTFKLKISASILQDPTGAALSPPQIDMNKEKIKLMSGTIWVLALR